MKKIYLSGIIILVLCSVSVLAAPYPFIAGWHFTSNALDEFGTYNAAISNVKNTTDKLGSANEAYFCNQSVSSFINTTGIPIIPTGDKTISFWIKPFHSNYNQVFMSNGMAGTTAHSGIDIHKYTFDSNKIGVQIGTGASDWISLLSTAPLTDNTSWHNIIVVESGSNVSLYIDGSYNTSGIGSGIEAAGNMYLTFCRAYDPTGPAFLNYTGSIDEVLIMNYALSPSAIASLYTSYDNWTISNYTVRTFDERTGNVINVSTVLAYNNLTSDTYTTINGSVLITDGSSFTNLRVSSSGYFSRNRIIDGRSYYDVYLLATNTTTMFTVIDDSVGSLVLPDALVIQYAYVNGQQVIAESKLTDITGRTLLAYFPTSMYMFTVSKDGYVPKTFTLDPPYFDAYTIRLKKSTATNYTAGDFTSVSLSYSPSPFMANKNNPTMVMFYSASNSLINYGYNMSYLTTTISNSSSLMGGATFYNNLSIGNTQYDDYVNLTIWYNSSLEGYKIFSYRIEIANPGNLTSMTNKDNTYGMGIFERVLVATIITILVGGLATLAAGGAAGLLLVLFLYGYFVYMGFIPIAAVVILFIVGFLLIAWRIEI